MDVVSGDPGAELLTRDALIQMFREFRQEMVVLLMDSSRTADSLKDDVSQVKGQLDGLRADHDSLQQAFAEFKGRVGEMKQFPFSLPTTHEEVRVASLNSFPLAPVKKPNYVVRILFLVLFFMFCCFSFLILFSVFALFFKRKKFIIFI